MDDLGFIPDQPKDDLGFVPEEPFYKTAAMGALGAVRDTAMSPMKFAQTLGEDPKALNRRAGPWLPAAGMAIGSAFEPGLGTAIGAGIGQMAKQAGDIAFEQPGRVLAGSNFSPRAGLEAAAQTALGGAGEVNAIARAPKAMSQAASDLPVVDLAVAKESKTPVALFAGNQDYGDGPKAIYTVYQKGQALGSRPTLPFDQLPKDVQIIGREARAAGSVPAGVTEMPEPLPYVQRGINYAGEKLAPVGQGIKSGIAKVSQAFTGAPARNAVQVMDKPETLLTTVGQVGKLGKGVEDAEAALSSKLTPELEAAITTNKGGVADDIVTNLMSQARTAPESITTHDAIAGIKSIDRTLPAPTRSNAPVLQKYYDLRSTLADIVSKDEPGYAAAKTAFSEAKGASQLRNIFPRTMTGNVSTVKTVLPLLLDWKRAAALPATSPIVHGVAMAAGSTAAKAVGFGISNPTARQTLISRYIESTFDGEKHK